MKTISTLLSPLRRVRKQNPKLRGLEGTYRFDIGGRHIYVSVQNGAAKVRESRANADFEMQASEEDFSDIMIGRRNFLTAIMQGRVRIKGDLMQAQKFYAAIRTPLHQKTESV
jgi:putative sterol carrier protein